MKYRKKLTAVTNKKCNAILIKGCNLKMIKCQYLGYCVLLSYPKLNTLIYFCNKIQCEERCQSTCIIRQQEMICWTPVTSMRGIYQTAEFHTCQMFNNSNAAAITLKLWHFIYSFLLTAFRWITDFCMSFKREAFSKKDIPRKKYFCNQLEKSLRSYYLIY